jgi:FkbM family methyltransferase
MNKYLNPYNYIVWLKRKYIDLILLTKQPIKLTTKALGEKVTFGITSNKEFRMRYLLSYTCEKSTMHWIEFCIGRNDIVWDIGANVGAYTLLIGQRLRTEEQRGHIFSFEPESSNYHSLNRNIQLNQLSDVVTAIPLAFGNKFKFAEFFLSSNETGSATHGLNIPESEGIKFEPSHKQGIISMSVDSFLEVDNVTFPNHIKIDVDGLESEIIDGMSKTLLDSRLRTIIIEIATSLSNGAIEKKILSAGFKIAMEEEFNDTPYAIKNILFERSN